MAEQNLFFFTGENEFLLSQELRTWKKAFVAKHGSENLLVLDGRQQTLIRILDAVGTMPFIAEKRLVVCEGMPAIDREELPDLIAGIHPQTVVAIVAPHVDRRLGLTKDLLKLSQAKVFEPLEGAALRSWITEYGRKFGATFTPQAVASIIDVVGSDQWMLASEIEKVAVCRAGREVTPADIDAVCVQSGSQVIWRLTDLLGNRRIPEAIAFYRSQLDHGEEPYGMWVVLLSMVKNLVAVWACIREGVTDERGISQSTGVHFLGVRGLKPLASSLTSERIQWLLNWAADADIALKTGEYKYTAERPDELISLTERLIVGCA